MPAAAAVVVGAAVGTGVWLAMRASTPGVTRFTLSSTGAAAVALDQVSIDLAITRDGRQIVYKGTGTNGNQLFVRALDQLEPTPLIGLGTPKGPFLSPDGQWIGFVDIGFLRRTQEGEHHGRSGPFPSAASTVKSRGATWSDDGSIIFATSLPSTGLQRVSSAGGEPTVLTTPDGSAGKAITSGRNSCPAAGRCCLRSRRRREGSRRQQVAVLDLRTGAQKTLLRDGSQAQFVPSGHLVYAAAGTLRAVAFDVDSPGSDRHAGARTAPGRDPADRRGGVRHRP
jgi:hypothetical protein